jgi:hypothetical protein
MKKILISFVAAVVSSLFALGAYAVDSTKVKPPSPKNLQLNCTLNFTNNYLGTQNISGPYNGSIREWETNYTRTDNAEIRCPQGYVLVGLISWHHSTGGVGGEYYSDTRGTCQQLTVTCSWS